MKTVVKLTVVSLFFLSCALGALVSASTVPTGTEGEPLMQAAAPEGFAGANSNETAITEAIDDYCNDAAIDDLLIEAIEAVFVGTDDYNLDDAVPEDHWWEYPHDLFPHDRDVLEDLEIEAIINDEDDEGAYGDTIIPAWEQLEEEIYNNTDTDADGNPDITDEYPNDPFDGGTLGF